jgi:hypothetical protein
MRGCGFHFLDILFKGKTKVIYFTPLVNIYFFIT